MKRTDAIRKEILMQLYALRPIAVSASRIQRDARKADYDYTLAEVEREAQFLADNGLIVPATSPATTEKLYRIHALGVTHYEQNLAS